MPGTQLDTDVSTTGRLTLTSQSLGRESKKSMRNYNAGYEHLTRGDMGFWGSTDERPNPGLRIREGSKLYVKNE